MTDVTDPSTEDRPAVRSRRRAAWTLVLLAPLIAEAAFSGVSLPVLWPALPLLVPVYGAGVLLARELVCRVGGGWPSLLVMGVAYELVEDGIGLQALTSPQLYHAAQWGPRLFGLNTTYWESQVAYHLVFTVLIPVAITELLFREQRGRPWLRRGGLVVTGLVAVVGAALLRFVIAGFEDPGYQAPWPALLGFVLGIAASSVVALAVLPRLNLRPVRPVPAPAPVVAGLVAAVATVVVLGLTFPAGHDPDGPAVGSGAWVAIPMVVAALVAIGTGWLVVGWSHSPGFTDRHRVLLIGGALVAHTLMALRSGLADVATPSDAVLRVAIALAVLVVTVVLLYRLDRRLRRR